MKENVGYRVNRQDFDQTVSQKHFLSTQDIRNIKLSVQENQVKRHENDATSVVQELEMEPFYPVLVYKRQGMVMPEYPTLGSDSFVLAIQTEFQMKMYREYSSKILCIDATHGTNAYRFKLITCIVVDQFNQGSNIIIIHCI